MGYVVHNIPSYSSTAVKTALLYSIDGGVNYSTDGLLISDGQASVCKNMWLQNGIITSRPEFAPVENGMFDGEKINSRYYFEEHMIIHCGTKLYSVGRKGAVSELLSGLPDEHSVPIEFSGLLYIYCGKYIFAVDRTLKAEEKMPYAPLYRENIYRSDDKSLGGTKVEAFEANIFAPCVSVTYAHSYSAGGNTLKDYYFPYDFDRTRKFEVYYKDEKLAEDKYTYDDEGFDLKGIKQKENGEIKLCYFTTNESICKKADMSGYTVGTAFGGGTLEGTRVILAGNSEHLGKYYTSELADGLYFKEDSGGTIGAGTENITAFSKQHGYLLIFTENTVSRMNYNYTSESGGYYSVHTINSSVGCDAPESVAVIDNRTVFVNSTGGIYIVDTLENYDMLNIVPISRNITDESRTKGLFALSEDELKKSVCCLYERKYLLLAGEKIFIWDYGHIPYSTSSDYAKAEKRLAWFEFDGICDAVSVMSVKSDLFVVKNVDGKNTLHMLDILADRLGTTEFELRTKSTDMNAPHAKKILRTFNIECKIHKETDVEILFYADGEQYHRIKEHIVPDKGGCAVISSRLPGYMLERFSFCVKCGTPGVGIFNIQLNYIISKSNLKK